MAGDHADIPFLQAEHYAKGRPDGPPLWIVWHTMEEDELADTAERVATFFAYNTGTRTVSAHYCADVDSIVQCVRLGDVAYTVGNRPGNYRGINIELAGRASQTAVQWADAYSQAMLKRMCVIVARDMARYSIPNRWCTVADLQARRPGHTTHNDLRVAFGGTTHTDPGTGFPRSQVLALVAGGQEDDVTPEELLNAPLASGSLPAYTTVAEWLKGGRAAESLAKALLDNMAELLAKPPVQSAPLDPAVVDAAVAKALSNPAVLAAVAKAVNDDSARRQAA
mgnify:CR=1 FL=1